MPKETRRSVLRTVGSTAAVGGLAVAGSGSAVAGTTNSLTIENPDGGTYDFSIVSTGELKTVNGNPAQGGKTYTSSKRETFDATFTGNIQSLVLSGSLLATINVSGDDGAIWDITGDAGASYSACFSGIGSAIRLENTDSYGPECINGEINDATDMDTFSSKGPVEFFGVAAASDSSVKIQRD